MRSTSYTLHPCGWSITNCIKKSNSFKLKTRCIRESEGKISETYNIYSAETFSFR